ncbi:ras-related protein rab-37 [Anaeramoeba ignava]|uniref:Ras-related protein rab-37 n=1 Tax=Anaeramoeba ignava TaxID=1746090 RepID=A0A9Q0LPX8_ANAIG|nr:ras-related protein rab-37 [Anaeramoeba ignava]
MTDLLFKIIIFGWQTVGKTSLINRYVDNIFAHEAIETIGVDFKDKTLAVEGKTVKLQLWDTAGQKKYQIPFTSTIYKNSHAFIVVFDLTSYESLVQVQEFLDKIEQSVEGRLIVIVGNKCDLPQIINNPEEELLKYTRGKKYKLFYTSAKDGTNVDELFRYIATELTKTSVPTRTRDEPLALTSDSEDDQAQNNQHVKPNQSKCC